MFRGQNQFLHARIVRDRHYLIGIEIGGIEDLFLLVAVTPLLIGEGIDSEMNESIELHLVPSKLPRRRRWPEWNR